MNSRKQRQPALNNNNSASFIPSKYVARLSALLTFSREMWESRDAEPASKALSRRARRDRGCPTRRGRSNGARGLRWDTEGAGSQPNNRGLGSSWTWSPRPADGGRADPCARGLYRPGLAPSPAVRTSGGRGRPDHGPGARRACAATLPLPPALATHVPNGEEDERCSKQQRQHVTEGRERERHGRGGAGSSAGASGEKRRRALWVKPFTSRGHSPHRRRRCRRHRRGARPPSALAHQLRRKAPSDGRSRPCTVLDRVHLTLTLTPTLKD